MTSLWTQGGDPPWVNSLHEGWISFLQCSTHLRQCDLTSYKGDLADLENAVGEETRGIYPCPLGPSMGFFDHYCRAATRMGRTHATWPYQPLSIGMSPAGKPLRLLRPAWSLHLGLSFKCRGSPVKRDVITNPSSKKRPMLHDGSYWHWPHRCRGKRQYYGLRTHLPAGDWTCCSSTTDPSPRP